MTEELRRAARIAVATVVALGCGAEPPQPPTPSAPGANLVLIVVDTLRADHLGAYGYPLPTSPAIDALAARGRLYANHVATSGQTVPSTLSLLLSLYPAEHGFLHVGDGHFARHRPHYPDELLFLAEVLRAAGWDTAGFVANPFLMPESGFAQGFDAFGFLRGPGDRLTDAATEWLRARGGDGKPFFLYLHYFDVHAPYAPPPQYRRRFKRPIGGRVVERNGPAPPDMRDVDLQRTVALYDAEIAFVDDQIAALLRELDALGVGGDTLVAVTSDHGEEFLDHGGLGHGTSVYGELVRVPLVLAGPGIGASERVDRLTHHVDLAPTLLAMLGVAVPGAFRGDLLTRAPELAFAEDGPWLAVHAGDRKLVLDRRTGDGVVFELSDALDQQPLPDDAAESALREHARWYGALERVDAVRSPDAAPSWSADDLERLRALGYAGGVAPDDARTARE